MSKLILFSLIFFVVTLYVRCQSQPGNTKNVANTERTDSLFEYHYKILDSLVYKNPFDTSSICRRSIKFMEDYTRIKASEDANYAGVMLFSQEDLIAWKEWHLKQKGKKK